MTEMENPKKRLKMDYETKTIEDLPEEIILKILSLVNIRDLFQCLAVNNKIRAFANDESLWVKMHIDGYNSNNELPAELLPKILAQGCQYLSLFNCRILTGTVKFPKNFQLKYLCVDPASYESDNKTFNILPDLAASCYSLEKLSFKRLHFKQEISQTELKFFKCIIQNSDTLKVLDLTQTRLSLTSVQRIVILCQNLVELNIATDCSQYYRKLCPESVEFICNNLTTTIEKLDISGQLNFGDDQFKTLIERCNRITEVSFVKTNVTVDSMNAIVEELSESLVKLRPSDYISFNKKLELLKSMPKFKVLIDSRLSNYSDISNVEREQLRKALPNMKTEGFDGELRIAEPYPYSSASVMRPSYKGDTGLVPSGFWEIKAKPRTYIQLNYPFYHCGFCYCGLRGCGLCRRHAEDEARGNTFRPGR